jgi:CTP synthase
MMPEQKKITAKGGTMRLGSYACEIVKNTLAFKIYEKTKTSERHRHRYEFNNHFLKDFEKNGMIISGINPDTKLAEIVELKEHPFFIGVQFHPEYKSTVLNPHPLFIKFIKAALLYSQQ